MKEYTIVKYPKNKDVDFSKLSKEQISIRSNLKKYIYSDQSTCIRCLKEQPINEFYIKDKNTGRRGRICRDCQMKQMGVIEIGKQRFAEDILKKGFRRCSVCKEIKPLTRYTKKVSAYKGYNNTCYECSNKLHHEWLEKKRGYKFPMITRSDRRNKPIKSDKS